jgi:hypothetical protein
MTPRDRDHRKVIRQATDDDDALSLVVGFRNYANLERLREGLTRYN